jgi:hypothetical protein
MVKRVLQKLIETNRAERHFVSLSQEGELFQVTLIHNETLAMFFNLDQRFFLSISLL